MDNEKKSPLPVWTNFRFTGEGMEYFKIWIVNILLTIITLGIYSPWAKVRTMSYFYGNTYLNDSSFAYLADPVKILKGRIIAVGVLAIYWVSINFYPETSLWALIVLILLFPFVLVMSMAFRMRNTAYRNIRFHFHADFIGAYRIFILPLGTALIITAILYTVFQGSDMATQMEESGNGAFRKEDMLLSIFLLSILPIIPYVNYLRSKFIINQTHYGTARGSFKATAWGFYKIYLLTFLIGFGLAFFLGIIMGIIAAAIGISSQGSEPSAENIGAMMTVFIPMVIFFYAIGFFIMGYFMARIANLTYNNTEIGPLLLQSHLRGRKIGWLLLSNTIAIVCSLGLLIPWSKIRMARYVAENTEFLEDQMETINAMAQSDKSAIGEEIGDMFDLDLGL